MNPYILKQLINNNPSFYTLYQLYCSKQPTTAQIADWFADVDFEALPPELSGMAANLSATHQFAGAPQHLIPRLRGIIKYCHTLNLGTIAGLCTLGKQYNQAGISMLLMGATALQIKHPEHPQRQLWQAELGITPSDFPQAIALATEAGFTVQENEFSAIVRNGNSQCIILYKLSPDTYVHHDAAPVTTGGVPFLMPSDAALFVSLAEAAFRTLQQSAPEKQLLTRLVHLHHAISSGVLWDTAAAIATKRSTANQVRLILELYTLLVPDAVAPDILESFGSDSRAERLATTLLTYRTLPQTRRKLRRLWLSVKIRQANRPYTAWYKFLLRLFRAGLHRITS